MAGLVQDCFSIGSTVACTTCYNQNIEGEVLAFDQQTKMLILSILFNEVRVHQWWYIQCHRLWPNIVLF